MSKKQLNKRIDVMEKRINIALANTARLSKQLTKLGHTLNEEDFSFTDRPGYEQQNKQDLSIKDTTEYNETWAEEHDRKYAEQQYSEHENEPDSHTDYGDTDSIDISRSAIIQAMWEQNADKPRDEIELAIQTFIDINAKHIRGFPEVDEDADYIDDTDYKDLYKQARSTNKILTINLAAANNILNKITDLLNQIHEVMDK